MIIQPMHPIDTETTQPSQTASPAPMFSGVCQLPKLGVIRAAGEDAVKFLQGQLTQDVALMGSNQARLAAFCNAKGRMQASFVVFKRSETEILMVCSVDLLAQTVKRLSMFVLRAKATISDASADNMLRGLAGDAAQSTAGTLQAPWAKTDAGAASVVALYPGAGQARALWCAPIGTPEPVATPLPAGVWDWLEVQSGIAMITLPLFEVLVPQMLNYESIGGVNFKKGCYPGQEIVARSQFRGTLKRRAYLAHTSAQPAVGQDVFHALDAEQPCGVVAAWAANPLPGADGYDVVVSMQTAAAGDAGDGRLSLDAAALTLLPLPYPLLEDI